jgi:hypothetical protein
MTTVIKSLDLFSSKKKHQYNSQNNTLLGIHTKELYSTVKTHTVFRQAIDALVENVFMHPLVYCKQNKYADTKLTPQWAITACCEIIDSFWAVGYAAVQIINNRIVVGVPTDFDLVYNTKLQQWELKENTGIRTVSTTKASWQLVLWQAPVRYSNNKTEVNSAAKRAEKDTAIYNQLHRNHRQKDYFNSNPSVFTTVDKNLKNVNGSSKQWFQSATASTAAATRTTPVDSNFKYLVNQRADSIRQLADATGLFRNSHNSTKLAGEDTETLEDSTHKQHIEHVVTDGRDIQPSRVLMSLTDGHQILLDAENKIFFHLCVPPQIKGRNINAERSGINPRLNEIALSQFFNLVNRLRTQLSLIFGHTSLEVAGATLTFQPCLSPYELDKLHPFLNTKILPLLYSRAYHVPDSFFDIEKLTASSMVQNKTTPADNFKRKRADDTETQDHSASTPEQAKKQKRAAEKHGVR